MIFERESACKTEMIFAIRYKCTAAVGGQDGGR